MSISLVVHHRRSRKWNDRKYRIHFVRNYLRPDWTSSPFNHPTTQAPVPHWIFEIIEKFITRTRDSNEHDGGQQHGGKEKSRIREEEKKEGNEKRKKRNLLENPKIVQKIYFFFFLSSILRPPFVDPKSPTWSPFPHPLPKSNQYLTEINMLLSVLSVRSLGNVYVVYSE